MNRLFPHRRVLAPIAVFASASLLHGSLMAQSTSAGTITGTVTDPSGAVIPGATITVTDTSTREQRTTVTGKEGLYVLPDVPPGKYDITATKTGFSKDEIPELTVAVGSQANANFRMAIGAESTTIEVQATNTDLQTMNASTGQTVDPVMVDSLPAIGRDVATFVTLQPGVTPGGMVAGTTADQATFQLDGGSNSSDMDGTQGVYTSNNVNSTTGGFIAGGPGGVIPMPQDSIEEFKVSTSGQTADFNNSSGSQSQIVTKRGHNQWHGTGYEYYLDSNFGANTWQNNFPAPLYTPKTSYHYSRFGGAAGGPILPNKFGGKTYFFANYEGFRYPQSQTYERSVPSYQFLQGGQLTFGGVTYSAAQLKAADPRGLGMNPTLAAYYNSELPVAPSSNAGSTGANGATYAGIFDQSCGVLSGPICDGVNVIGYRANYLIPQSSNFLATRIDHDFGAKWHLMASYRYYSLVNLTGNQVDIGGVLAGDKIGQPQALTPRPQDPWFFVVGLTTNITPNLTNDFHYSYLRNDWQWKGAGAPPQVAGAGGAIEPLGENTLASATGVAGTNVLSPYNVNAQNIRTRIWDGKDNFFRDDLTLLKGDHLLQFGGQFEHNFNYHQRTDNGASINYTPTYLIGDSGGGGNVAYAGTTSSPAGTVGLGTVGANANIAYARILDTYYGIVTDTQVANTYGNKDGALTLNPSYTPISANTSIPYYNTYITDTWHVKPTLTLNYGLSYAIEMPPSERNGNQVMLTDVSGNAIRVQDFLSQRQAAAAQGQIYNPEIGFALIHNVVGNRKYPYDPYYKALSPRVSFAYNPGAGGTVIRGGYGRIFARINGDAQVLNPLLSPGLILATQCKYVQSNNACNQSNFTDSTAFRFGSTAAGLDGTSPVLASAPAPLQLAQPYHPGFDGPGVALASPLDPSLRPAAADTFNFSIQRQINRKMLMEVGYIGRNVHHEYIMLNPNQVPYNLSLGGQTFVQAYDAIETAYGCTVSASLCAKSATPAVAPQPFFEAALAGGGYCTGYSSCTAAVIAKQGSKFRAQQVFSLWQALDNNKMGAGAAGFNFGRSLMGTPVSNATYGSAGQVVTGLSMGTGAGYSNYNGMYVSFKASGYHGLTLQENFTYSKALGLGAYNQSTSSIAAEDNFNLQEQYGRQGFDQKFIFNTFIVWQTPWYARQSGFVGRLAGGWTLSPVLVAGTGQPLQCVSNNNGQNFGGEDGSNFTDSENCVFTSHYDAAHTNRGVLGGVDPNKVSVGTNPKGTNATNAEVNVFSNPVAAYDAARPPILGIDTQDGGNGVINGLGYLNIDFSVKKQLVVWEKASLEFTGVFYNLMNHLDFSNPSLSLQSTTNWGTVKTQQNSPRQIQMGIRASF
ncbi:MAG TPA: carboxypeptidase-like regulatory domain-containing protein [Acidobacteriaceae bacterium]|nr:carboxypeptidase-like regulatory domain-containing protein [Acidobacteriaceae bacterium]